MNAHLNLSLLEIPGVEETPFRSSCRIYLVRVICEEGFDGLANGMRRSTIQERIQHIHHRPDDVRASDMSNLLHNLAATQAAKNISPPIIDYDQSSKLLQVVDSTFYFFLKNSNLPEFLNLFNPLDDYSAKRSVVVSESVPSTESQDA